MAIIHAELFTGLSERSKMYLIKGKFYQKFYFAHCSCRFELSDFIMSSNVCRYQ